MSEIVEGVGDLIEGIGDAIGDLIEDVFDNDFLTVAAVVGLSMWAAGAFTPAAGAGAGGAEAAAAGAIGEASAVGEAAMAGAEAAGAGAAAAGATPTALGLGDAAMADLGLLETGAVGAEAVGASSVPVAAGGAAAPGTIAAGATPPAAAGGLLESGWGWPLAMVGGQALSGMALADEQAREREEEQRRYNRGSYYGRSRDGATQVDLNLGQGLLDVQDDYFRNRGSRTAPVQTYQNRNRRG